ncbi:MAG: hypothetical protein WCE38_05560 [Burkholderiales bacterium]
MSNFWDILWLIFSTFVFVAYILILFQIVIDLFRDHELGGGFKALLDAGTLDAGEFAKLKAKALA